MKNVWLRLLCVLLTSAMVMPLAVACSKDEKDDEDDKDELDPRGDTALEDYVFKLSLNESEVTLLTDYYGGLDKVSFTEDYAYDENEDGSLFWDSGNVNGASVSQIYVSNWTEYNYLIMRIYSPKATGGKAQIRFSTPKLESSPANQMAPYCRYQFTVDWTGWKEFKIAIDDLGTNYSPDFSAIQSISFDCSGWEMTPDGKTELYFGYMYLEKTVYSISPSLDDFDDTIYTKIKNNWRTLLVGNEKTNSSKSEAVTSKITSINNTCKNSWDKFQSTFESNTRDSLFNITIVQGKSGDESKINTIYNHLYNMAMGYATYGSDYYQNQKLYNNIRQGLEYCYKYYYGPCVWEEGTYGNWWYWDIGIPLVLTKILILLEEPLGQEKVKKYLEPFDYLDYYPSMTACNKVWISYCVFASAALQNDGERLLISQYKMNNVFDYVSSGDGFYTDGSFVQHDAHAYTGGYGLSMLTTLTDIMYVFNNTRFQMIDENVSNQYRWIFDNFQMVIYDGNFFANMRGREVYRNTSETAAGNTAIVSMIKMIQYAPDNIKAQLKSLVKYYLNASSVSYESQAGIAFADFTTALRTDESVTARNDYIKTVVFGNMDRVVSHNSKYGVSISLNSTRIYKYEAINNENMDGWYLGDGMIYIYTDGYDYDYSFYHNVDKYKLPGTTVSTETRTEENLSGGIRNGSAFAGGVTIGEYGIAVLDLTPSTNKYFNSKLDARKSYFIFDNEIVALGSGITDTSGYNINTIIENRLWNSDDSVTVNGAAFNPASNQTYTRDAASMHFTNMGGYVFFDTVSVKLQKANSGSATFFEAWIEHGTNPKGEDYAYVYLPEATVEETTAYQANKDVTIIAQDEKVHAVKENTLGITGYVFWEAGSCNGVTASEACTLMIKEENGAVTVSVSDPTHQLSSATVTIDLSSLGNSVTADDNIEASVSGNTLTLNIDFTDNVGQSFNVTVK